MVVTVLVPVLIAGAGTVVMSVCVVLAFFGLTERSLTTYRGCVVPGACWVFSVAAAVAVYREGGLIGLACSAGASLLLARLVYVNKQVAEAVYKVAVRCWAEPGREALGARRQGGRTAVRSNVRAVEICTHRSEMFYVTETDLCDDALSSLSGSGFSRAPVLDETGTYAVGVVHLRDLVNSQTLVRDVMREALCASVSTKAYALFSLMNTQRSHLAVLLSDVGELYGIVTMEDVVEEVVGDIYDETDAGPLFVERPDGSVEVPGSFHLVDLARIGFIVPKTAARFANTVSGALCYVLGRFPEEGDVVPLEGFEIVVIEASGKVATKVRLVRTTG